MAKTLTANFGLNNFDAAFFADDAAVFHAFIFTAIALIIFDWPENLGTEQTIAFGLERSVVNRFGLFYFTMAPLKDFLRTGQADAHRLKTRWILWTFKRIRIYICHSFTSY